MTQWETIDVPRGAFIGWGNKKGQHVTGTVLAYGETDGSDFNGDPCPQLEIELSERAASFNKDGERSNYEPGDLVVLTCGQVSLKRAVKKANPRRGDMLKITLENLAKVANGTVKEFGIQIARGAGKVSAEPSEDNVTEVDSVGGDTPPF